MDMPKDGSIATEASVEVVDTNSASLEDRATNVAAPTGDVPAKAKETDISDLSRRICVVTTASLPWRTGTAVNPLARALYLTRGRPKHHVSLVIPWLKDVEDQEKIFGSELTFSSKEEQECWIRKYCVDSMNCADEQDNMQIIFYDAVYNDVFGSIFATADICSLIPSDEADVAILEEPEHLNWFRAPPETDETMDGEDQLTAEVGWLLKFRYVIGILHTNYSAYVNQYGYGASFIAAAALDALSSIVVRAYCHRIIRLSATLPIFDKSKEITSNVHGVRHEFLEPPNILEKSDASCSPIYFIGKLVWAKGFMQLLHVQESYRQRNGEYFAIDVYGSGKDTKEIERAFFGRLSSQGNAKEPSQEEDKVVAAISDDQITDAFDGSESLREKIDSKSEPNSTIHPVPKESATSPRSNAFGLLDCDPDPMSIVRDSWNGTVRCATATTTAIKRLSEDLIAAGMDASFSTKSKDNQDSNFPELCFDPPKSRFELRKHPVPTKFHGVKDHALLKDVSEHKIFLNMSETEVLCTTTAEALAMGKFAIIPKHPSNDFFEQFPNCLMFSSHEQAIELIEWALLNSPKPLSESHKRSLSWEGGTERLYEACLLTTAEYAASVNTDCSLAKFHAKASQKGRFIQKLLSHDYKK